MRCPYCGHGDDRVVDTRATPQETGIRRRRECTQCGRRFTTYEYVERMPDEQEAIYFSFLAEVGITKHMGALESTKQLIELCSIEQEQAVPELALRAFP